jgi:hypothetical protein
MMLIARVAFAGPDVYIGGIAQPQFAWWDSDPDKVVAQPKQTGFVLRRARIIAGANWATEYVTFGARVEAEMTPQFQLLDAFVSAEGRTRGHGFWRVEVGQTFAPFSRQTMTPVSNLQMLDFAQLVQLTPNRQIGGLVHLAVPYAPWLQISFGAFNGEGPNVTENIDNHAMYVGRLAFRPIGWGVNTFTESGLGENQVSLGANFAHNVRDRGDYDETQVQVGADAFFCWRGLSAYVEYYWSNTSYPPGTPKQDFVSQGFNAQLGYLLPIPGKLYRRFELAARFEAIATNQTVPIESAGDPTQARAAYGGGIHYYHKGHSAKIGVEYYHNQELDETDRTGRDATYSNDTVLAQITYRLE